MASARGDMMGYEAPLTIKDTVESIHRRKYQLPAIQREFVWGENQIIDLFDSLMLKYPIGTFLFWKVNMETAQQFKFYYFLDNYHELNQRHNKPASDIKDPNGITAILDGQQRLTALNIGLMGSYASKLPNKRKNDPKSYPQKKLYLNLLEESASEGSTYDFCFLSDEEVKPTPRKFWFRVGKILEYPEWSKAASIVEKEVRPVMESINSDSWDEEVSEFAAETVATLWDVIHQKGSISYYKESSNSLSKVLRIFIRVNSGGTQLSYSDLLLSIITAKWDNLDAKDVINNAVNEINGIGRGFNVNKDFILRACLVLSDFDDIAFKVDNFNSESAFKIESEWEEIFSALKGAVNLVDSLGFNGDNIKANSLLIPIAYYFKLHNLKENYYSSTASEAKRDTEQIKMWLICAMLKRIFSFSPEGVLKPVRKIIFDHKGQGFPLDQIVEHFRQTPNRTLVFYPDDIDGLLQLQYGNPGTLPVLSMLFPFVDLSKITHVDHIFPKSQFHKRVLSERGIDKGVHHKFLDHFNSLANLQLLDGPVNSAKQDMDFLRWVEKEYPDDDARRDYFDKNLIPVNIDLEFESFPNFFEERNKLIRKKLEKELIVD